MLFQAEFLGFTSQCLSSQGVCFSIRIEDPAANGLHSGFTLGRGSGMTDHSLQDPTLPVPASGRQISHLIPLRGFMIPHRDGLVQAHPMSSGERENPVKEGKRSGGHGQDGL